MGTLCGVTESRWKVTVGLVGDKGGEVPLEVTLGSVGTQGPHGVGGWVMSHRG